MAKREIRFYKSFQKKTQKTPSSEIEKANKLMKEYFNEKQ
ncbi:MAG: type II toxin-antitoxin system RelE/ParE family toxin [Bacteroidales bacterium]|nr:type II toxin-antitoxin system RelE/ParE family toxin [Bacteroidales bacterium]